MHLSLRQTIDPKFHLQRSSSSKTYKSLPVICVTCEFSIHNNLRNKGMELHGSTFNCDTHIKPVVCCFNCQKFGHISTNYFNKHFCKYCGKDHPFQQPCSPESFFANCSIPRHPSKSQECPKYTEKRALISHEVSPTQHYFL